MTIELLTGEDQRPCKTERKTRNVKHIDEQKLEEDLDYRYEYLAEFMGFGEADVAVIHRVAPQIMPKVPEIVDATYQALLAYDATARHFLPRGQGYEGPLAETLDALAANHEQIQFRKQHLTTYLMNVLGRPYDQSMVRYLDVVSKMHTRHGGSPRIDVPVVQMNAFMGKLAELLMDAILSLDLDRQTSLETVKAFHKLLWIQNDLIGRWYRKPADDK